MLSVSLLLPSVFYLLADTPHAPSALHVHSIHPFLSNPACPSPPHSRADWGSLAHVAAARRLDVDRCNPFDPAIGRIIRLPLGDTHYRLLGPESGRRVVMVHGLTETSTSVKWIAEDLAARGYRVLGYDVYGRGYSSSPDGAYSGQMYVEQLRALLDFLGWDKPIVMGNSMGGGIAASFADAFPDRVDALVLLCPAGMMRQNELPFTLRLLSFPVFGLLFAYLFGRKAILSDVQVSSDARVTHYFNVKKMNVLHHPGFLRAFVRTVRNGPIRGLEALYARVAAAFGRRVVCVWGTRDNVTLWPTHADRFRKLFPQASFHAIEGAGHDLLLFNTQETMTHILRFLDSL